MALEEGVECISLRLGSTCRMLLQAAWETLGRALCCLNTQPHRLVWLSWMLLPGPSTPSQGSLSLHTLCLAVGNMLSVPSLKCPGYFRTGVDPDRKSLPPQLPAAHDSTLSLALGALQSRRPGHFPLSLNNLSQTLCRKGHPMLLLPHQTPQGPQLHVIQLTFPYLSHLAP